MQSVRRLALLLLAAGACTPFGAATDHEPSPSKKDGAATSTADAEPSEPAPGREALAGYAFGSLATSAQHAAEESAAGMKVAMLDLDWSQYEPGRGEFDPDYAREKRAEMDALLAAGMRVTLGVGLHSAPSWLFNLPNSHFVADDDATVAPGSVNLVFNQKLRVEAEAFFDRIQTDLDLSRFWAVRVTSGSEYALFYPSPDSKPGRYWAFDENARNGPDMPSTMKRNPFPDYFPGDDFTLSRADRAKWMDWYIDALDDVVDWQMRSFNVRGFKGWFQLVTPGGGVRPSEYEDLIDEDLPPSDLGLGVAWHRVYAGLRDRTRVVAYASALADGTGHDEGCEAADRQIALDDPAANAWSAPRWIARIADEYGLPKNGENRSFDAASDPDAYRSGETLSLALRQMTTCRFQGMYWAHDDRLWDGTFAFAKYATGIQSVNPDVSAVPAFP